MDRRTFLAGSAAGAAGLTCAAGGGMAAWRGLQDPRERGRLSFSQQGEDIVLFHVVQDVLKVERATYVDVGAAHPVISNNTYLLYTLGGSGVLVEPNPSFARLLRKRRPRDQVVEAGIGVDETTAADYYVIKGNPLLNTFSADQVAALQKGQSESVVEAVMKMPLLSLSRVITERLGRAPDVLSTDVEGLDLDILRTLDLDRLRPGAICTETTELWNDGRVSAITEYLRAKGYVPRGGSLVNTIYVDAARLA